MTDTILQALNKLVEKSGGDPSDNKLIVDAINDLVETGGGGSSYFQILAGENVFMEILDESMPTLTFDRLKELWDEHAGTIMVSSLPTETNALLHYHGSLHGGWFEFRTFSVNTNGGLSDGLVVDTHHIVLRPSGYEEDTEGSLRGHHIWSVSAQNDD